MRQSLHQDVSRSRRRPVLPLGLALALALTGPNPGAADSLDDLPIPNRVYLPLTVSAVHRSQIETRCWERVRYDIGDDGVDTTKVSFYTDPERVQEIFLLAHDDQNTSRETYQYDDAGRTTEAARDADSDGTVDHIWQYGYNDHGTMIWRRDDRDADGVSDNSAWFFMDDANRQIRAEYDSDGDTRLDTITHTEYGVDGRTGRHFVDDGADGTIDQATAYRWEMGDDFERLLIDMHDDGTTDRVSQRRFDSEGREIEFGTDNDVDGVYDTVERYSYNHRDLLERWDTLEDGHLHAIRHYEYDARARVIRRTIIGLFATRTYTYQYDGCSIASNRVNVGAALRGDGTHSQPSIEEFGVPSDRVDRLSRHGVEP